MTLLISSSERVVSLGCFSGEHGVGDFGLVKG